MKKIITNTTYLSMGIGVLLAYISLITFFFIKSQLYFSIMLIINLLVNFLIIAYNTVKYDEYSDKFKILTKGSFILITLFALIMDVVIISNFWDMNIYDNVMYITNIKLYLTMYAVLMLIILLFDLYFLIKEKNVTQNSTNETKNTKK